MENINTTEVKAYPPSTHPPLQEGEIVYKIIGEINRGRATELYRAYYRTIHPAQLMSMVFSNFNARWESLAKHKATNKIYRISTQTLGYITGTRVGGGQEGVIENPVLYGYDVLWERAGYKYKNFEDETVLLSLSDIIILDAKGLREELLSETQPIQNR